MSVLPAQTLVTREAGSGRPAKLLHAALAIGMLAVPLAACQNSSSHQGNDTPRSAGLFRKDQPDRKLIDKAIARTSRAGADGMVSFGKIRVPMNQTTLGFSGTPRGSSLVETINRGRVPIPEVTAYLRQIMERLLKDWPAPLPEIGVFVTPSPGFGALSTETGDILINIGTIQRAETEDQLAAILAHEVGHILLNHHERIEKARQNRKNIANVAGFAMMGLYMASLKSERYGDTVQVSVGNERKLNKQLQQAMGYYMAATTIADDILDSL